MKSGIWHKRFRRPLHPAVRAFSDSTVDDRRLVRYEIMACLAHVQMLKRCRILKKVEADALLRALNALMIRHKTGKFRMKNALEDVHINVEKAVKKIAGPIGDKLHTARSRNDLIATDLRLYARNCAKEMIKRLTDLRKEFRNQARRYARAVIPGFTHLRPAQPITWSFYMQAQVSKFERDISCLKDALKRVNVSPLGSAALAGTSHPINPGMTARLLGFDRAAANAHDAVSDRDFIAELLYVCSQIAVHVASLCEDMIIYSGPEYDLIDLDDSISTGSSIMPQKKNPDLFELLRAKSGNAIGNLCAVLTMLKGLPSSYNRDLQEIKPVFIRQIDESLKCLEVLTVGIARIRVKEKDWIDQPSFMCATALVDHLVQRGIAFRRAYDLVADCVKKSNADVYLFMQLCAKETGIDEETVRRNLTPSKLTGLG